MTEDKPPDVPTNAADTRAAAAAARGFFRTRTDPASLRRAVRRWLVGAIWSALLIPLIFYLRFGEVGPLAWGLTVFCAVFCLLAAVAFNFLARPEYHTTAAPRHDWLDRVGAFWLMACAFGPLFGWVLTSVFTLTEGNWRWLYWGRAGLSVGLPVLTALPLLRYARGRGAPLMLALLVAVTALPVWSGWATLKDLRSGPVSLPVGPAPAAGYPAGGTYLPHTGKVLAKP